MYALWTSGRSCAAMLDLPSGTNQVDASLPHCCKDQRVRSVLDQYNVQMVSGDARTLASTVQPPVADDEGPSR
jgi:hypothetical protein